VKNAVFDTLSSIKKYSNEEIANNLHELSLQKYDRKRLPSTTGINDGHQRRASTTGINAEQSIDRCTRPVNSTDAL